MEPYFIMIFLILISAMLLYRIMQSQQYKKTINNYNIFGGMKNGEESEEEEEKTEENMEE